MSTATAPVFASASEAMAMVHAGLSFLAGADARQAGFPLKRDPYVLETTVPGVFVAGDVRARSIKRVASAVGEGSMAVSLIHEYLAE